MNFIYNKIQLNKNLTKVPFLRAIKFNVRFFGGEGIGGGIGGEEGGGDGGGEGHGGEGGGGEGGGGISGDI